MPAADRPVEAVALQVLLLVLCGVGDAASVGAEDAATRAALFQMLLQRLLLQPDDQPARGAALRTADGERADAAVNVEVALEVVSAAGREAAKGTRPARPREPGGDAATTGELLTADGRLCVAADCSAHRADPIRVHRVNKGVLHVAAGLAEEVRERQDHRGRGGGQLDLRLSFGLSHRVRVSRGCSGAVEDDEDAEESSSPAAGGSSE